MDVIDTLLKVSQAGSTVLLLVAVYGAAKGWWVPRWLYDEALKREEVAAKRETAVWTLYEREKTTSEKLLAVQHRQQEVPS